MSKNLTRKGLAIAAGAALGLSSLVALPAQAAAYAVEVDLTDGESWSVFNEDVLSVDVTLPTLLDATISATNFAFIVTNPDSADLTFTFDGVDGVGGTYDVTVLDADDAVLAASAANAVVVDGTAEAIDFATDSGVVAIFSDFKDAGGDPVAPTAIEIARDGAAFGDDGVSIGLTAWVDDNGDFTDVTASTKSASQTITFVDPATVSVIAKVERAKADGAVYLNEDGVAALAASVRFSKVINLDQTDWTSWTWKVATDGVVAGADANIAPTEDLYDGFDSSDAAGKALLTFAVAANLAGGSDYQIRANYDGETRIFSSAAFEVVEASNADADGISFAVTEGANVLDNGAGAVDVRTGTKTTTLVAQIDDGGVDLEVANQPVVVTVTAVSGTAAVAGVSGTAAEGEAKVWNTLTNADGQVEVVVTSSAAKGDEYVVEAYLLNSTGNDVASDQAFTVSYVDAVVTDWDASSTVVTGSSITLSVEVVDQFGEPISVSGTKAINVGLLATDTDNLESYKAVTAGKASFTFNNWLAAGESDVLTLNAYTGASDDQTAVAALGDISVTMYATLAVTAVTVTDDSLDATVGYYDFGTDPTLVAGDRATINGTVIDSVGAGIPGAPVTLSGAGIQFESAAGDFAVGSITVTADEAGTFAVDAWTHLADDTVVTVTSGGKSTKVTITGELAVDTAANLKLSWNLPAALVYNTTYAVTATLTDVWGNPVPNASLTFAGEAAAQFNGDVDVVKTTSSKGTATAYLRSLADVTGLAAVSLTLADNIDYNGGGNDVTDVGDTFADDADTLWDESAATDVIEAEVNFLKTAPVGTGAAKVNVGSFNGKLVVYAQGLDGAKISWKVGGKWGTAVASGNTLNRFDRLTPRKGVTVSVDIYVNGVKTLTKSVVTK